MARIVIRTSTGPPRGRQPRYESLVHRGDDRFYAITRLPSGRRVAVRLGRLETKRG